MFNEFADRVGKAHTQLMEGAITYFEFFCFCAARVHETIEDPGYEEAKAEAEKEFAALPSWMEDKK